jgi:hypothetical protein
VLLGVVHFSTLKNHHVPGQSAVTCSAHTLWHKYGNGAAVEIRLLHTPTNQNQPLQLQIGNCTAVDQSWIVNGLFSKIGFLTHAAFTSLLHTLTYQSVHSTVFRILAPEPDMLCSHYTITLHLCRQTLHFILQDTFSQQKPNQVWSPKHQVSTLPTHTI